MVIDNAEFLSVIHQLISDSKECIEKLTEYNRQNTPDEDVQVLIVSAASLLTIHNSLIAQLAEQNASIIDRANTLIEQIKDYNEL